MNATLSNPFYKVYLCVPVKVKKMQNFRNGCNSSEKQIFVIFDKFNSFLMIFIRRIK